jgi:hypothetical protein
VLTSTQYEAIGRLSLAFNELEYSIEFYSALLISAPEWSVSTMLAEQGHFEAKATRLDSILQAIAGEHTELLSDCNALRDSVKRAKELANERNRYVHALVVDDLGSSDTRLRARGKEFVCNENEIVFLANGMSNLGFEIANQCGALHFSVDELRNRNRGTEQHDGAAFEGD